MRALAARAGRGGGLLAALLLAALAQAATPEQDRAAADAAATASTGAVAQGALLPRDSPEAAAFRGGLVYANYCVTCHGINADGNGRAAKLYTPRPANLRTSDKNNDYVRLIVTRGGAAIGRSEFMPTWEAELTNEQINDVVAYVRSISALKP